MRSAAPTASVGRTPLDVELPLGAVPGILLRRWRAVAAGGGVFTALVLAAAVLDYSTSVYHIVARLEVTREVVSGEMFPLADPEVLAEELGDPATQRGIYEQAGVNGGPKRLNRILAVEAVDENTVRITMTANNIDAALAMETAAREEFGRRSAEHARTLLATRQQTRTQWEAVIENLKELQAGPGPVDPPVLRALRSFQGHLEDHVRDATRSTVRSARLADVPVIYGEWVGEKYLQYGWTLLAGVFAGVFWTLYTEGRARLAAAAGTCTTSAG